MESFPRSDNFDVAPAECPPEPGQGPSGVSSSRRLPRPDAVNASRVRWLSATILVGFHLLLLLALVPWLFSWTGLVLIPVGNYVFCSLGIGAGYHRLLAHRSFKCGRWLEHIFALLGICSLQDSPLRWVMIHRMHHQHSDRPPDPHSPLVSWFWAHMGWLMVENRELQSIETYQHYVPDLLQDSFYLRLERGYRWLGVYAAHALVFLLAGLIAGWVTTGEFPGAVQFGLSLLVYGVVFRTVYSWHITWGVNSLAHLYGYRNFHTAEDSRNNWLIALTTNGEGWHNNHHADPRSAVHGHFRWWELDVTYLTISGLQRLGLVFDVVPRRVPETSRQKA
jgi:fatty-acid desaturase